MSFNPFAAGRKIYGQGATSPTRGAVDPKGYIKRELARKSNQQGVSRVGRDGQSDTRSGLASQAMQRNGMYNNTGRPQAGNMQAPKQQPNGSSIPKYTGINSGTSPAPVNTNAVGAAPAPPVPVQANANGILELPYNSEFYQQAMDAQAGFDAEMMTLGSEEQQQALEYQRFMRELESGYVDQQRNTLNGTAGNGMLYSSQYTTGVNRDGTQYNNTKNDASTDNTNFMTNMAARKNAASSGFNSFIQRLVNGYNDSLLGEAGSLGYGVDGEASAALGAPVGAQPIIANNLGNNVGRPKASALKPPKPPKKSSGLNQSGGLASPEPPKPPKKKGKK